MTRELFIVLVQTFAIKNERISPYESIKMVRAAAQVIPDAGLTERNWPDNLDLLVQWVYDGASAQYPRWEIA